MKHLQVVGRKAGDQLLLFLFNNYANIQKSFPMPSLNIWWQFCSVLLQVDLSFKLYILKGIRRQNVVRYANMHNLRCSAYFPFYRWRKDQWFPGEIGFRISAFSDPHYRNQASYQLPLENDCNLFLSACKCTQCYVHVCLLHSGGKLRSPISTWGTVERQTWLML